MSDAAAAVIVNYKAKDHLLVCIQSLRADGVQSIVVVDNDSNDGSAEAVAAADPDVTYVALGTNRGYGTASNRGVAMLREPYVLVTNPDVVIEPGTVKALVAALERDRRLAAVGPRIDDPDGTLYPSARVFPDLGVAAGHAFLGYVAPRNRWTVAYRKLDWDHSTASEVDWISGSCFMARRSAYEAVNGFDERYFMYAEDVDLCWRFWQAGWRVAYEPAGRVVHRGGASTDQAPYRMILEHHRSLWRFARKTAHGSRKKQLALPAVAAGLGARTALSWGQRALEGWRTSR